MAAYVWRVAWLVCVSKLITISGGGLHSECNIYGRSYCFYYHILFGLVVVAAAETATICLLILHHHCRYHIRLLILLCAVQICKLIEDFLRYSGIRKWPWLSFRRSYVKFVLNRFNCKYFKYWLCCFIYFHFIETVFHSIIYNDFI